MPFILEMLDGGLDVDEEDLPVELETQAARDVLNTFWRLHACRGSNGFGPGPITYESMAAFQQLTAETLSPWLVEMVHMLDTQFLNAAADVMKRGE